LSRFTASYLLPAPGAADRPAPTPAARRPITLFEPRPDFIPEADLANMPEHLRWQAPVRPNALMEGLDGADQGQTPSASA